MDKSEMFVRMVTQIYARVWLAVRGTAAACIYECVREIQCAAGPLDRFVVHMVLWLKDPIGNKS